MVKFSRILFPVDLSGIGEKIAPYVRMMVDCHQAELVLLHVLDTSSSYRGMVEAYFDWDALEAELRNSAEEKLAKIAGEIFQGLDGVGKAVLQGRPGQEIRDYAGQNRIDLIIMASHARKGLDYAFFGSVAHKVARNSQVPVLLINPSTV